MSRLGHSGWKTMLVAAAAFSFIAAACSSSDDSAVVSAEAAVDGSGLAVADEQAAEQALLREQGEATPAGVDAVISAIDLGRDIIYTADLSIAVADVRDSEQEALLVVNSMGGFVFGQQSTGTPEVRSTLVFKVPPDRFQEALRRLGDLGTVSSQNVFADDVTERVVDLESRIKTAEASVERLNGFLAQATDVKSIAELEAQLLERETVLETLRGQLRTLEDRVDYASITLVLTEALSRPEIALFTTAYAGGDGTGAACPAGTDVSVVQDGPATICFEITNTGDTPLRDFDLTDPVLGIEMADLVVVFGDPAATMQPGQSMVLAADVVVERDTRTQTTVTGVPVDDNDQPVEARSVATTDSMFVLAEDPGGLPGFRDGLEAGADVIGAIGGALVLAAGVILPFLPVLLLGGLFVVWRKRKPQDPGDAAA